MREETNMGSHTLIQFSTKVPTNNIPFELPYGAETIKLADTTYEVGTLWRFYSESDTRGPWYKIHAVLAYLLSHPNVKAVWYARDDDFSGTTPQLTKKRFTELNNHYYASFIDGEEI